MGSTLFVTNPAALPVRNTNFRTPLISQLHRQFSEARFAHSGPNPIIIGKVRSLGRPGFRSPTNGSGSFELRRQCLSSSTAGNVSSSSSDAIVLDVEGMMCEGCVSSVKKILEGQPQVSSANVDLTTHTASVLPVAEAKVEPNWQKQLGESLANHLSTCGFNSRLRGP